MKHTKHRMKAKAKSWAKWQVKKQMNDFAKTEIAQWLKRPKKGKCTAAMDHIIGTYQSVYGCVKEKYDKLKTIACDPPAQFKTLKDNIDTAVGIAKFLKKNSQPFQNVPKVGPFAKQLSKIAGLFVQKADPKRKMLEKLFSQPRRWIKEDADCCPPLATKDKKCKNDWKYKCGGCEKGAMCYANQFCNSLTKMENKVNAWKKAYFDPAIDSMTVATVNAQSVNSLLAKCGVNSCTEAEKFARGVKKMVEQKFLDKFCPIPTPSLKMPNLGLINTVLGFLKKIKAVIDKIKGYLSKEFCVPIPKIKFWTEQKCANVKLPCCSSKSSRRRSLLFVEDSNAVVDDGSHGKRWGGRRRRRWFKAITKTVSKVAKKVAKTKIVKKIGKVAKKIAKKIPIKCGFCTNRVCVPVPKSKAWMDKVCFSAQLILDGLGAAIRVFFAPIMKVIKLFLDKIMAPIWSMINKLIDQFFAPLKKLGGFKFPDLKVMQIDLPKLPVPFDCNFVKKKIKDGR